MKTFTKLSIAAALALSATAASADNTGWYAGAGVGFYNYEETGIPDLNLRAIQVQAGNRLHENFAIEVRAGLGIGDDSTSVGPVTAKLELDHMVGAYAKAILPTGPVDLYAFAGFTRAKLTASATFLSNTERLSESDSDTSYGIGATFNTSDKVSLNAEYGRFFDKDGVKIDGFTLGANYAF